MASDGVNPLSSEALKERIDARHDSDDDARISSLIRAEIRNIGIPPRPAILERIDAELHKDEPDFKRLGESIGADVGLAASVIKVANSPLFGSSKKVRSVPEALLVVGLRATIQTIAGFELKRTFPNLPSLERFWDSACRTARVSGFLARLLKGRGGVRPEDAYTFGLFRDCGIPVLMLPFPEYSNVLRQANEESALPFTEVEDRQLSINHAAVGSMLAEDWRLPDDICQAIRHHHDASALGDGRSGDLPETTPNLIAIGQLAEHLIQIITGLSQTNEWNKLGDACMHLLDISSDELASIGEECRDIVTGTDLPEDA